MARKSPLPPKKPNTFLRLSLFWAILVFGILGAFALANPVQNLEEVPISSVIERANNGEIAKIELQGNELR